MVCLKRRVDITSQVMLCPEASATLVVARLNLSLKSAESTST